MLSVDRLLDDRALVAAAQAGDAEAMHDLLSRLHPVLLNYCRSRLARFPGGLDVAEDVAQEACVAVFTVLPRYQDQGAPFAAWAYAIAANKVIDAQRRSGRSAVPVEDVPEQVEPSPTPEEQVMSDASVRLVEQLLDQLPERMREVLRLRADGASADLIGRHLGMKPGAVRVLQHRAIAKLRTLLVESEEHRELLLLRGSATGAGRPSREEPSLLSA